MTELTESYSRCGEDRIILFLAKHILHLDSIYYLDLDANDETALNNTKLLCREGFRGVSVDADPAFEGGYKRNCPEDVFVVAGVGTKTTRPLLYKIGPHTLSTFSTLEAKNYTNKGLRKEISLKKGPI